MARLDTQGAIQIAGGHLYTLAGHKFELLTLAKPVSPEAALNLAKVISKLSPLLGNLIEFNTCEFLNDFEEFKEYGKWRRQDPGFPDTILDGSIKPTPGFEIKAWFPLATEITARFRDSQNRFADNNTYVAMLAWLPDNLIYGVPYIVDVMVASGSSIAKARDDHYHNPPDYLVLEPEDTSARTANLQQTNTAGYKFQGTSGEFEQARKIVSGWGRGGNAYKPTAEYQHQLLELTNRFKYRLDTNYAKVDRIVHAEIEEFKKKVNGTKVNGMTVNQWCKVFDSDDDEMIRHYLEIHLSIKEVKVEKLLE
jgi:hypothetical protein